MKNRVISASIFVISVFMVIFVLVSCRGGRDTRPTEIFSGQHVSAGRTVSGLQAFLISYYEAVPGEGLAGGGAWAIQESDEPFTIVDFGPRDELPSEITRPSIYVVFSQPVVPLAQLGQPLREDARLFYIEPPLEGIFRWYGTRLLSFEPSADSIPQMEYRITVSDQIRSLGGRRLEGERSFTFETQRLRVLSWQLGNGDTWVNAHDAPPEDARYSRLIFSYPVNLEEIANWIEVRAAGQNLPFTLSRIPDFDERRHRAEQGVLLRLDDLPPANTQVSVHILAGARSEPGWLGARQDRNFSFHTLRPLRFIRATVRTDVRPRSPDPGTTPISLEFSHVIDPYLSPALFSVAGMPALTAENIRVFGRMVQITGLPLEFESSYQVSISGNVRDRFGRSLGQNQTTQAVVGQASSFVHFENTGSRMLEAGFPPKIVWETINPISIRSMMARADGPYQRLPGRPPLRDISMVPRNARHFFVEDFGHLLGPTGRGSVAMSWEHETRSAWRPGEIVRGTSWLTLQVTDIGITLRQAYNRTLVWATRLSSGEPIANARVELMEGENVIRTGSTNAQGLAVFEFRNGEFISNFTNFPHWDINWGDADRSRGFRVRVIEGGGAMAGGDQAEFIPNDSHNLWRFRTAGVASPFHVERARPLIFLFTDRGIYRPGETVTFRGIDRTLLRGNFYAYQGEYTVEVSTGWGGAPVIAHLRGRTTNMGGSYGSFTLPENLAPGTYVIRYTRVSDNASGSVSFVVANFERLRFEASLQFNEPFAFQGEQISARLGASYLAGGVMSGAPFYYFWSREPVTFNPSGVWRHWHFGPQVWDGRFFAASGEGVLGPDGSAGISHNVDLDGIEGISYRYSLEASVQDAARQQVSTRNSLLVHPASFYIASRLDTGNLSSPDLSGARASAFFIAAGSQATVSWALLTPEGSPFTDAPPLISFALVRHEWRQSRQAGIGGRINLNWERVEEIVMERSFTPGRNEHSGVIHFSPPVSGSWEIRLEGRDAQGRLAKTHYSFFVSGSGWVHWGDRDVDAITLTPELPSYAPGDTARLLVQSPLPYGKYLLTIEREGIIQQRIIELDGSALTIDIPIEESFIPVVYVSLSSFTTRTGPPEHNYFTPDLDRPRGLFGLATLFVDHSSRNYQVEIESSRSVYGPGEEAEITLRVSLNGRPAAGVELTFMAVDRGVLDLINHRVPDPMAFFYNPANFPLGVRGADSRSLLIDPVTYSITDLQGGDKMADEMRAGAAAAPMDERIDFRPTAVFKPFLVTGADGTVTVRFTLPDSLTTFRSTAVAAGVNNFGIAEKDIRVSAPLTAVPAMPRRLRWRDTGTVSLLLVNLDNAPVEATVSVHTEVIESGAWDTVLEIDGANERTVRLNPGASAEVSFLAAALGAGESRVIFTLRSPLVNERIIRTIRVDRPVVYESVTTIGSLGNENPFIEEGIVLPSLIPIGTGSLTVSLSGSRLGMLREAVQFLLDYPFGGLEHRTARLLPLIAFADHLETFGLESPIRDPGRVIAEELDFLARSQLQDGSFPFWPGGRHRDIYVTLRVAHIVALARQNGHAIPEALDTQALIQFITNLDRFDRIFARDPFLKGYSLWVRAMHGERISAEISAYLRQGDELGISGWGFAGLAALELGLNDIAISARDRIRRFIRPGVRTVDLTDTHDRRGNFWGADSDRFAIALMLYQALSPDDDMTTRLANSLIERQRRGVWRNTSSTHWAVLAFSRVAAAEAAGNQGPVNSRASIGGRQLMEKTFEPFAVVPALRTWTFDEAPFTDLERDTLLPLRIEREGGGNGRGRLYYTASLRYGIPAELAAPRDEGFSVFARTFDSAGNLVTNGVLVPGRTYTRRVTISTSRDRTFVALRAPVPSGAEIVDAVFVTSPTIPPREAANGDEMLQWRNWQAPPMRFVMDNEVIFHWDFFPSGRREVEFRFRAVMPGIYPTPPVQAESMYEPEIFGRGAGELFRIGF